MPEPHCKSGGILVRNAASLISAGTERAVIEFAGKSLVGKAKDRPDLVKQVLDKVKKDGLAPTIQTVVSRLDQPLPLGYSCAGIVAEVGSGAEEFAAGNRVACAGMGYASHAQTIFVPRNLSVRIPDGVTFEDASYVTLGAIALQGVRVADVRLGESVAVIGLGLLGQLTVQILKASGCRVVAIDLDPAKVELSREFGADLSVSRADDVLAAVAGFTAGVGVDAAIVTAATSSNDPTELAGEVCRDRGRVSMVGAVKMDIPRKVFYDKELELRLSRSYGPGRYDPEYEERGRDYPIGYVRWTERRNMEAFLRLVAAGQVTPGRLTTHRFQIGEAGLAYDILTGKTPASFMGIVLEYPTPASHRPERTIELRGSRGSRGARGKVGLGFIGAGNFAKAVLLPRFAEVSSAELVGIATATGLNGRSVGDKFGFRYATTDFRRLLEDDDVDAVVVATRHNSHAFFAEQALRAGKAVFVEKPLALDEASLEKVLAAQNESGALLTVGFNRRFSPMVQKLKAAFATNLPIAVTYRINAGPIPPDSWIHHPDEGGGRIIGEVCHFVDLAQHLVGTEPAEVFAYGLGGDSGALHDNVTINLRFGNGSIASINYLAGGDKTHPKELIEVFGGGTIGILDDFRRLTISRGGSRRRIRRVSQEKGFAEEVAAFARALSSGGNAPIPLASLAATTRATFAIEESLRTGRPVTVSA